MGYRLKPGVSFCETGGRLLFLDVPRDRYICLSPPAEQAFRRLVAGELASAPEEEVLRRMSRCGPLEVVDQGSVLEACPGAPTLLGSLLDGAPPRAAWWSVANAALGVARAAFELRRQGLAGLIGRTRSLKQAVDAARAPCVGVARTAAAFARLSAHLTAHDRCLVRSVAVARWLIATGCRPELVIGVKLQPFKAHCWVQHDGWLVTDRADVVRPFTPILIV